MTTGRHTIAGLVLASGLSRRFASDNKLLARVRGSTVVRRTVEAYLEAELDPVIVVVGHDAEQVAAALGGLPVTTVMNPEYREGQSRALIRGVRSLPDDVVAAVIGVGDQPLLSADDIRFLVAAYGRTGRAIVVPRYAGRRGNPVLFDKSLFAELLKVTGDQGGRPVIERHAGAVEWVDVDHVAAGTDVDTMEDLERITAEEPRK